MHQDLNEILVRRANKFFVENTDTSSKATCIITASLLKNLASLGYTLSLALQEKFNYLTIDELTVAYLSLTDILKKNLGVNENYFPMYPNFPKQVMEASEAELYLNAIVHYLTNGELVPGYIKNENLPLIDNRELKVINLATENDLPELIYNLISSKTNISETDKNDIKTYLEVTKDISAVPGHITNKEILAFTASILIKNDIKWCEEVYHLFKTATDVLRLCVALSDGDVSLAENTKFINLKRSQRRFILSLFENAGNIEEDMIRYKNVYIRLGEKLHPGEYAHKYPKTVEAFNKLRNNIKIETFNSITEDLIKRNSVRELTEHLKTRPGEFARRLNVLFTLSVKNVDDDYILDNFEEVADQVSTAVLLQVMTYFKFRNEVDDKRAFFIKGNTANVKIINNELCKLDEYIQANVRLICAKVLIDRFGQLPPLGKVYIAEKLSDYIIPFSQRSASKALKTIVRGSKIDFENDTQYLRFFLYWKNKNQRVDVDLSAGLFNKDWKCLGEIAYYDLKNEEMNCCHSGDFVSAANGASEFIDIDIEKCKAAGVQYVAMTVHSYTETLYSDMEECFAGWMSRNGIRSGEVFEPKTVENRIDLTSKSLISIPLIIDIVNKKIIWCDLASKKRGYGGLFSGNNLLNSKSNIIELCKIMCNLKKCDLGTLFSLHAAGRGELVDKKEDADITFDVKDATITPYDIEKIMGEWM